MGILLRKVLIWRATLVDEVLHELYGYLDVVKALAGRIDIVEVVDELVPAPTTRTVMWRAVRAVNGAAARAWSCGHTG